MDQIVDYFEPNIKVYTINDQNCVLYVKLYVWQGKKSSSTWIPVAIASSFYLHSSKFRCMHEKKENSTRMTVMYKKWDKIK